MRGGTSEGGGHGGGGVGGGVSANNVQTASRPMIPGLLRTVRRGRIPTPVRAATPSTRPKEIE